MNDLPTSRIFYGKDEHGNFEIVDPPHKGANSEAIRAEADRQVLRNTLAGAKRPQ